MWFEREKSQSRGIRTPRPCGLKEEDRQVQLAVLGLKASSQGLLCNCLDRPSRSAIGSRFDVDHHYGLLISNGTGLNVEKEEEAKAELRFLSDSAVVFLEDCDHSWPI